MPYSEKAGKEFIKKTVARLAPKTILDIGAGAGTYSKLLRTNEHWTALEVWAPYIEKFNLKNLYDEIIIEDVRNWTPKKYDVAIAGDVLEHMSAQESQGVLIKLRKNIDFTFVSVPFGTNPQGEVEGNPYEAHVEEYWNHEKMLLNFGPPLMYIIEDGDWCTMGVYLYSRIFNK